MANKATKVNLVRAGHAKVVSRIIRENPVLEMKHRVFAPRGAARKLWASHDESVVIVGPAGTGKSRTALEKAHFIAMKYPQARILLVRKTRESLTESVLATFEEKVLPPGSALLMGPKRAIRQDYTYPNGSKIIPGGLDKASKIMSTDYDIIIVFEATEISEDDYEHLNSRLRNGRVPYQQIILDCNPGAPSHWIYQHIKKGLLVHLQSVHTDNPRWYDEDGNLTPQGTLYMKRLNRLTGVRHDRYVKGLWVAAEGAIYPGFTPDHIYPNDVIHFKGNPPAEWRRIRSIDFGYTKPFVCQWWAIDGDERMYLYREIYMTRKLVRDHARLILMLSAGENIETTIADWDAEGRADLESAGIPTIPAFKEIQPGIEAVALRLRKEEDGKARLFFDRDAIVEKDQDLEDSGEPTNSLGEFDSYVWKRTKEGRDKEEPIDEYNHGMDAMRYAVTFIDKTGRGVVNVCLEPALVVRQGETSGFSGKMDEVRKSPFVVFVD